MSSVTAMLVAMVTCVVLTTCLAEDTASGTSYLERYGYLGEDVANEQVANLMQANPGEAMRLALMEFQRFAGLEMTGVMDSYTAAMMNTSRCGVPDGNMMQIAKKRRRKRYAREGSKWGGNFLTYKILNYYPGLSRTMQEEEIKKAFDMWALYTPLSFDRKITGAADIDIEFRAGAHGDGYPFDGRSGTLAHAFYPQYGGNAHMDADELFTSGEDRGTNFFQVFLHEIGHSLGLAHSDDQNAIMAPFYRGYIPNFRLHTDDIAGIRAIYGSNTVAMPTTTPAPTTRPPTTRSTTTRSTTRPTTTRSTTPSTTTTTSRPSSGGGLCPGGRVDAMTVVVGRTYAFSGDECALLSDRDYAIESGYPVKISAEFPGVPSDIDASLYWPSYAGSAERTYFFKGEMYWKWEDGEVVDGYPREIASGWPGIPDNLDAAFVWSGNDRTYFVKDDNYYRYSRGRGLDAGYPRPLAVWKGVPASVDSVFRYTNGRTYFFSDDDYYRFNDNGFGVDAGYPRPTSQWWLGCNSAPGRVEHEQMDQENEVFVVIDTVSNNIDTNPAGGTSSAVTSYPRGWALIINLVLLTLNYNK